MKAVMLSLRHQWRKKIFDGEKTIEVRKSRPSLDMPVKVYVYETKAQFVKSVRGACTTYGYGRGKVIGSFVCNSATCCQAYYGEGGEKHLTNTFGIDLKRACLTEDELFNYIIGKHGKIGTGWLWHITAPKLYDKPKELGEFYVPCKKYNDGELHCMEWDCEHYSFFPDANGDAEEECLCKRRKPLRHPPQSWCYVEELQ